MSVRIEHGDCLVIMRRLAAEGVLVDSVVCDPPYGLEFMGRDWDGADGFRRSLNAADAGRDDAFGRTSRRAPEYRAGHLFQAWCEEWARIAFALLKPGGHLAAFGGTRTYHRLACAIEDAGFEIRDQLAWTYGTGFPKSQNVSKAIDKAARGVPQGGSDPTSVNHGKFKGGCSPENVRGQGFGAGPGQFMAQAGERVNRELVSEAQAWEGWGTALKPAWEPICLARKPLIGTVAANVLQHGTGAMNIDDCRVPTEGGSPSAQMRARARDTGKTPGRPGEYRETLEDRTSPERYMEERPGEALGRWPANVIHDGSEEVLACFPDTVSVGHTPARRGAAGMWSGEGGGLNGNYGSDTKHGTGSAARFFFSSKAGPDDRCDSKHPTIKPVALMRWLARLVTPPGGLVLDPFAGSGTTGVACLREGFGCILIEREDQYVADIRHRIAKLSGLDTPLFAMAPP